MSLKIAVLISGSGTTLQNIIDCCESGAIAGEVVFVLASRKDAYGLTRAENVGIPSATVPRKEFSNTDEFSNAIWSQVEPHQPDLVVLAGFMSLLHVPKAYEGRIMNVHPALIPSFCGQGMYGHHVHQAVLDYGAKITGVTVHFVNEEYDNGPIILQNTVPVEEGDTADTLAERVQAEERDLYPKAIQLFAEGRLQLDGRLVHILPKG
ncbi:MAG: phosphoribosylglycinamide formyltransferase [Candidatus Hydrogenedentota bacterium]